MSWYLLQPFFVYCTLCCLSEAATIRFNFTASDLQPYIENPLEAVINDNLHIDCGGHLFALYRMEYIEDYESCNSTCPRTRLVGICVVGNLYNAIVIPLLGSAGINLAAIVTYEVDTTYYFTSLECSHGSCLPCLNDQALANGLCSEGLKFTMRVTSPTNQGGSYVKTTKDDTETYTKPNIEGGNSANTTVVGEIGGSSPGTFGSRLIIIVAAGGGSFILLMVLVIIAIACCCCVSKKKRKEKLHSSKKKCIDDEIALTSKIDTDSIECGGAVTNVNLRANSINSLQKHDIKKEDIRIILETDGCKKKSEVGDNIKKRIAGFNSNVDSKNTGDTDDNKEEREVRYSKPPITSLSNGVDNDNVKRIAGFETKIDCKKEVNDSEHKERKPRPFKPPIAAHSNARRGNQENCINQGNKKESTDAIPSSSLPIKPLPSTAPKPLHKISASSSGTQTSSAKPAQSRGAKTIAGNVVSRNDSKVMSSLPNKFPSHGHSVSSSGRPVRSNPESKATSSNSNKPLPEIPHKSVSQSERKSSTAGVSKAAVGASLPIAVPVSSSGRPVHSNPESKATSSNSNKPLPEIRHKSVSQSERKSSTAGVSKAAVGASLPIAVPVSSSGRPVRSNPESKKTSSNSNQPLPEIRHKSFSQSERKSSTAGVSKAAVGASLPIAVPNGCKDDLKASSSQRPGHTSKPKLRVDITQQKRPTRRAPSAPTSEGSMGRTSRKTASQNSNAKT